MVSSPSPLRRRKRAPWKIINIHLFFTVFQACRPFSSGANNNQIRETSVENALQRHQNKCIKPCGRHPQNIKNQAQNRSRGLRRPLRSQVGASWAVLSGLGWLLGALGHAQVALGRSLGGPRCVPGWAPGSRSSESSRGPHRFFYKDIIF